jgi:hypothetical protein
MIRSCALTLFVAVSAAGCGQDEPRCDPTVVGHICTVAGNGDNAYLGDDGPALQASMSLPQDILVDDDGSLYILDWNNHRLRKVTTDGQIVHVAGRGELGGTLDDPANNDFNHPTGLLFTPDRTGIVIAAWHNSKIRTLDLATGAIVDTCGDGRRAYFGDEGPALVASLDLPASIAYAPNGDLIVMDQANQVLRSIDAQGIIHRYAGVCVVEPAGGCGTSQLSFCPEQSGKQTCDQSLCGQPCTPGYTGDGGPAAELRMSQPFGQSADPAGRIIFDADDSLIFADTNNQIIRRIAADGTVTTIAGTAPVNGALQFGYSGDGGPAVDALLNNPVDLALADDGTLYVTDVYNHCVRAVDSAGIITTVAGVCEQPGFKGDGGPAVDALLKRPYGLTIANNVLYIADTGNNVIRVVPLE